MASADLRKELDCSICLNIYIDPVTLRCGHNFCRDCINRVLDTQEGSGVYSCPDCRAECQERPALIKNITLCNIVGSLQSSTRPDLEDTGIFCTYCVDSPVPAAKSCLLCEASLCVKHLKVHSKSAEHILCDPTTSPGNRKCSVHKKKLDFYCNNDSACICAYCLTGEHSGHRVEMLDKVYEKKKEKLREVLQKLTTRSEETEKQIQSFQERKRDVQEKAAGVTERVSQLFIDIRRQLEDLENRVLREISRQEKQVSVSVSEMIQKLEIKKDELSMKMCHINELFHISDIVTFLQEPDIGDMSDTQDREAHDQQVPNEGNLDVGLISGTLQTLLEIIRDINMGIYALEPADILLDVNTAGSSVIISEDKKTASRSQHAQNYPETPERFRRYSQVLSTRKFSSGQHSWEVEFIKTKSWRIGMCYPSIIRSGNHSCIGNNNKSWALRWHNNQYAVIHNRREIQLSDKSPCDKIRICLDYEAGQLSFYSLSHPIRLLHTVKTTFTEPLHAVLAVWEGSIKVSGGARSWEL